MNNKCKQFTAHYVTEFQSHMGENIRSYQTQIGAFAGVQKTWYTRVLLGLVLGQLLS